jgi:hypothetical protein
MPADPFIRRTSGIVTFEAAHYGSIVRLGAVAFVIFAVESEGKVVLFKKARYLGVL